MIFNDIVPETITREYKGFTGIGGSYVCKYLFPDVAALNRKDILFDTKTYNKDNLPEGIKSNNHHLEFGEARYLDSIVHISTNIGAGMEFHPQLIVIASSIVGSSTYTGWKRRVSAWSFSIYF